MAINFSIYSNSNVSSKTVAVDFVADFLASSSNGVSDQTKYFFKVTSSAVDTSGNRIGAKVSESLSDLVLSNERQSASDTAAPYADIKTMVIDYVYDFTYGHDANQYGTSNLVKEQKPIKFN